MAPTFRPETAPGQEAVTAPRSPSGNEPARSRAGVRDAVRGLGFQEGSRALSPGRPGTSAQPLTTRTVSRTDLAPGSPGGPETPPPSSQAYEQALGRVLGGALYEVVVQQTSPESLARHARAVVDALMKAGESLANQDESLDESGRKAVIEALQERMGPALKGEAEAFLNSEEGRSLAASLQSYAVTHPWEVVAMAILAMAGAVAANVPVPRLGGRTSGSLGPEEGEARWVAEAGVDLGRVRDLAIQAIDARIGIEAGRFRGEVGVEHQMNQGTIGRFSAEYGTGGASVTTTARLDRDGLLSASAGARIRTDHGEGTLGVSKDRNGPATVDATVQFSDGSGQVLKGAAKVDAGGAWSVRLSQEFTRETWKRIDAIEMSREGASSFTEIRGNQGPMEFGARIENGGPSGTRLSGEATYRLEDLTAALRSRLGGGDARLQGEIERKVGDRWTLGGTAEYGLLDGRLLSLGLRFGFRDPKEFEAFLVEWHREHASDVPLDRFRLALEHTLGSYLVRVDHQATWKNGRFSSAVGSIQTARELDQNWKVIAGVSAGYGPEKTQGLRPEIGLQYRNIPVTVGYDLNQKSFGIRLTLPFGR